MIGEKEIKKAVSEAFGVSVERMESRDQTREPADARKAYCLLMRKWTGIGFVRLAVTVNRRHPAMVHATRAGEYLLKTNRAFKILYFKAFERLNELDSEKKP